MKFEPLFTQKQISRLLEKKKEAIVNAVISRFQRIGEPIITNARNNNTYKVQTGNLRSSIGYIIIRNGVQLNAGFSDQGTVVGLNAGKELMDRIVAALIAQYPQSIFLVCVAGMSYAAAVESTGRDVITGSSQIAMQELKAAIDGIRRKANT